MWCGHALRRHCDRRDRFRRRSWLRNDRLLNQRRRSGFFRDARRSHWLRRQNRRERLLIQPRRETWRSDQLQRGRVTDSGVGLALMKAAKPQCSADAKAMNGERNAQAKFERASFHVLLLRSAGATFAIRWGERPREAAGWQPRPTACLPDYARLVYELEPRGQRGAYLDRFNWMEVNFLRRRATGRGLRFVKI